MCPRQPHIGTDQSNRYFRRRRKSFPLKEEKKKKVTFSFVKRLSLPCMCSTYIIGHLCQHRIYKVRSLFVYNYASVPCASESTLWGLGRLTSVFLFLPKICLGL